MKPKPIHLGLQYASQFCDESVARAYHTRPPYPEDTFEILIRLLPEGRHTSILDLGCGTGDLTIPLSIRVDHIDAIDFSEAMLSFAQGRSGRDSSNIHWYCSSAEAFDSDNVYSLICAGQSLHWMDWEVIFPKIKQMLHNDGFLAIADREILEYPWTSKVKEIIPHYSTNREFRPFNLVDELTSRDLFTEHGRKKTGSVLFKQSIEDYIESFHSGNGFSRDRMDENAASEFDTLVKEIVATYTRDTIINGEVRATVIWGKP